MRSCMVQARSDTTADNYLCYVTCLLGRWTGVSACLALQFTATRSHHHYMRGTGSSMCHRAQAWSLRLKYKKLTSFWTAGQIPSGRFTDPPGNFQHKIRYVELQKTHRSIQGFLLLVGYLGAQSLRSWFCTARMWPISNLGALKMYLSRFFWHDMVLLGGHWSMQVPDQDSFLKSKLGSLNLFISVQQMATDQKYPKMYPKFWFCTETTWEVKSRVGVECSNLEDLIL